MLAVAPAVAAEDPDGAQQDDSGGAQQDDPPAQQPVPADEARGWEQEPGVEGEDVALFVPRALLAVPRLGVAVVSWPLRQGLRAVDRYHLVDWADALVYWDADHTVGLSPSVSYWTRYGFTWGGDLFHRSLLGYGEALELSGRFGGRSDQAWDLSFEGDRVAGSRLWVESHAVVERGTRLLYAGVGMEDASGAPWPESWYLEDRTLGLLRAGVTMGPRARPIQLGGTLLVSQRSFAPLADSEGDRVSIDVLYDLEDIAGFQQGVALAELDANLVYDSRRTAGLDTTGTRLELFLGATPPVSEARFVHGGAEVAHTLDLFHRTRLLTLRGAVEAVDGASIPMSALPRLGGPDRLRGYDEDRFRDAVATLGSLEYRYPVHQRVMGELFLDVGTVTPTFSALWDGAATWKTGMGGGLVVGDDQGITLRVEVGYGDDLHVFAATDLARTFQGRSLRP